MSSHDPITAHPELEPGNFFSLDSFQALANDRQRRFVGEFLVDCNATQAAVRAGYSAPTARQQGSRLLTDVDIQEALNECRERLASRLELSAESVLQRLVDLSTEAREARQFSPAIRSLELLGRHLGMFDKERSEPTGSDATVIEAETVEEDGRDDLARLRDFTGDIRMMAEQRGALQRSVEDFLDDLEEMCDTATSARKGISEPV